MSMIKRGMQVPARGLLVAFGLLLMASTAHATHAPASPNAVADERRWARRMVSARSCASRAFRSTT